jgi:hypothetical protein
VANVLKRTTFSTSRLAEFCSKDELVRQTGHNVLDWPLVIMKALVDNALDAAEEAGIAPVIKVTFDETGITVTDNGPGIAPEAVASILDYSTRTSSREAYVSPTRGAQGNALQTILAMGHATGKGGKTVIESHGIAHTITFAIDPIKREPVISHTKTRSSIRTGARVMVEWSVSAGNIPSRIVRDAWSYGFFNQHLAMAIHNRLGDRPSVLKCNAIDSDWRKWSPKDPTSPHWYDEARFKNLIAANIDHAEKYGLPCRTVGDFVSEFRGLSGTAKRRDICDAIGASRMSLADLLRGHLDGGLLYHMKETSQPVKPHDLGLIGKDRLFAQFGEIELKTFRYKKIEVTVDGIPHLAECAFGYCPDLDQRQLYTGLNWSIAIGGNPFQSLRYDDGLSAILAEQRAGLNEPVVFFLHLASPRLAFLDKGKSVVALPDEVDKVITDAVLHVTKAWAKQRKAEERNASAEARRIDRLTKSDRPFSLKAAAERVMRDAYMRASDDNKLPANARQIMYAARPQVLELTGKDNLDDQYLTQTLLVNYMAEFADDCANWNVVWSDRGHFTEPHTGLVVGLGTLAVRGYVGGYRAPVLCEAGISSAWISTKGPRGRYGGLLFIEKEGFDPLLEHAQIAKKYDLAVMSCKGMSVTAARELADRTCARYKIPLYILHDFDISGFSIAKTVHSTNRRFQFKTRPLPCRRTWRCRSRPISRSTQPPLGMRQCGVCWTNSDKRSGSTVCERGDVHAFGDAAFGAPP